MKRWHSGWRPREARSAAVLAAGLLILAAAPAAADEDRPRGLTIERLDITAVTVVVSATDADGRPVADLTAEDFAVAEDGTPATVLDLAPVKAPAPEAPVETLPEEPEPGAEPADAPPPADARPAQAKDLPVAIYVNRTVGGGFDQRQALRAVAGELERLVALGPVEVVVAEKGQVETLAGPTGDLPAIRAALGDLAGRKTGQHAIEGIRRRFIREIRTVPTRGQVTGSGAGVTFAARTAAGEEHIIVSRSIEQLRFWAQRETGQRAGLLVLVGAGFDEDPFEFYSSFVEKREPQNVFQLREDLREYKTEASVNQLGRELASTGWRILAVAGQTTGTAAYGAESRTDKFATFLSNSDAVHASESEYLLVDPIASQRYLAEPSGGDVAVGPAGLTRALDQATGWYQLTYQVDRTPDGQAHELELSVRRPGVEVKTTKVVTAATSEGQAEARARRLLGGAAERGDLVVELALGPPTAAGGGRRRGKRGGKNGDKLNAEVQATVHFGDLAPLMRPGSVLRVSVATVAGDAEPTVSHRREQLTEALAGWIYVFPIEWPATAGKLAVTVEEIASGVWGGAVVDLPEDR